MICSHINCLEGEGDDVKHHSEGTQLGRLLDERKKQAALVSQTRVSYTSI